MTSRCDHEGLSLYAYGFLEETECVSVEKHLRTCPRCRAAAERLLRERDLVAFELGVDAHAFDPEPVVEVVLARRPRGRIGALAFAASLLMTASLAAWFALRPEAPGEVGWRSLPDGSRYRVVDVAEVETPPEIRRLELDSGSLVLEVVPGEEEFWLATPFASVRSDGGRFAISVGSGGTIVEVLEGSARVEPIEGGVERIVPTANGEVHVVYVEIDPDPALLARVHELEERLRELEAEDSPEAPFTPEQAVENHDWGTLAHSLAEVAPDLREGRLPRDPEVLRRYLRSLVELHRLAKAVGVEPTVEAIARDPRTGPSLFAENVRRLWPDAPEVDIEVARAAARDAIRKYADDVAVAETPAETAAAEETLKNDLAREVERVEDLNGPPTKEPLKIEVRPAIPATPDETPTPAAEDPPVETKPPSAADRILEASGFSATTSRVYEGTPKELMGRLVKGWTFDRGYPLTAATTLEAHASRWLEDHADVRTRAPVAVVAAFDALLGRGPAPAGVSPAEVKALRDRLIEVQTAVERHLPVGTKSPPPPVPTFFLIEAERTSLPQASRVK